MAYHQSHLRSAIAGRRHLGDASIGAKIGLSSRRSSRVVLEGKELFPYSPFDYAIQEVDSQGYARAVPSSVRKVMAMSRRKKAALKGIDHKREPSSVIDNKKTSFVSFTLCKVDMSTLTAIANISSATGIPVQEFIFTDKTDSYALTGQRICVRSEYLASLREFEAQQNFLDGFGITECSYMEEDISPYAPHSDKSIEEALHGLTSRGFINYYPPQRFPMNSHLVGDALLVKDFPRAMRLLIEYFRETTTSEVLKEAAEEYLFSADPVAVIDIMRRGNIPSRARLYQLMEALKGSTGSRSLEETLRTYQEGKFWNVCINQANPSWRWNIAAAERIARSERIEVGDVVLDEGGRLRRVTIDTVNNFPLSSLMMPRASSVISEASAAAVAASALAPAEGMDLRCIGEVWSDGLVVEDDAAEAAYVATDIRFRGNIRYRPLLVTPQDVRLHFELIPTRGITPPRRNAIISFGLPLGTSGMAFHKALTGGSMSSMLEQ